MRIPARSLFALFRRFGGDLNQIWRKSGDPRSTLWGERPGSGSSCHFLRSAWTRTGCLLFLASHWHPNLTVNQKWFLLNGVNMIMWQLKQVMIIYLRPLHRWNDSRICLGFYHVSVPDLALTVPHFRILPSLTGMTAFSENFRMVLLRHQPLFKPQTQMSKGILFYFVFIGDVGCIGYFLSQKCQPKIY